MTTMEHAEKLLQLVEEGTSPFHVTASVERQLCEAGFQKLSMKRDWGLDNGRKYYLNYNGSSLVAFTIGENFVYGDEFRIAAAHSDFPGLRVKSRPEITQDGYRQLNVEVYGGAILNTWLDRPLSVSGRVALRSDDAFHPKMRYVDFRKPFLTIPNLAIHINRDMNKGVELNKQKDMLPILGLDGEESKDFFLEHLARQLEVDKEKILEYELGLYNAEAGDFLGMSEEFISSPRLDNLTSVQAVTTALIEGTRKRGINVAAIFDHEEIGSKTKQGAGSMLLSAVLERILLSYGRGREKFLESFADSMLLSVDVGHALHPNKVDKNDPTNKDILGKGICIKEASTQAYATDSEAVAIMQQICEVEKIPYQKFVNRSDGTSGSTLGSIASSFLPVKTVDIGVPLLAMHSSRELMGTQDQESLVRAVTAFYGWE
ncbi:MAG: M18 family aminopeptidase [Lachnospiraceae bacterium]|jgi:aspartyl aminopeptidase|nr:M18 family aminopeptidase [Lachnospiraceae bacterium]